MPDRTALADVPPEPAARPPEQPSPAGDDLRQRLGRLADSHPSSERYRASDDGQPDHRQAVDHTGDRTHADSRREPASDGSTRGELRGDARESASGWQSADTRDQRDPPAETDIAIADDRARHILDGDPDSDDGGHRHGTGRPGKTEFPKDWSDSYTLSVVTNVGRDPDHVEWQPNGRWRVFGDHDGVRVSVVVRSDGRIWTAWPEPGGRGVVQNPEAS